MNIKSIVASLLVVLLAGCAAPSIAPVQGESLKGLRSEKIAVNYTVATKKINYLETLYRVLWLETKTSSQDYSGIWDPDKELTASAVAKLRQQGFAATSAYDSLNPGTLATMNKSWGDLMIASSTKNHPEISGVKLIPEKDFFLSNQAATNLAPLAGALKEKGFRYLVQLSAMDITGNAVGYGMVAVGASPAVQVIDLTTGKIIWVSPVFHSEVYQLGGDLKALEVDGMKKTKEGLSAGIAKINFEGLWGLATAKQ